MTENPVATEFPDKDEKKRGGKKEKSKKKGNVAHIYCMMFQITALGKINLPATKMCNPLRNGGGRGGRRCGSRFLHWLKRFLFSSSA